MYVRVRVFQADFDLVAQADALLLVRRCGCGWACGWVARGAGEKRTKSVRILEGAPLTFLRRRASLPRPLPGTFLYNRFDGFFARGIAGTNARPSAHAARRNRAHRNRRTEAVIARLQRWRREHNVMWVPELFRADGITLRDRFMTNLAARARRFEPDLGGINGIYLTRVIGTTFG